jgi:hypothetical protein
MAVRWIVPPTGIAAQIRVRAEGVRAGTLVLGSTHAARGEAQMKARAPWNDRTGNARQGLFGRVEAGGTSLTITMGGTVSYQPYLELGTSKMAPRPIIVPVTQETAAALVKDVTALVRRLFG